MAQLKKCLLPYQLFLLLLRDILSDDYVRSAQAALWNLPYWNEGRNHLIFNLFSGSWPDYSQDLNFDAGHALLAKSSAPGHTFRPG